MEDYFRKIFIIKNGWRLEIIQLELNSEWMKDNSFENCVARGYAKSSRLEMTRFPRNVSPRPRVRLFPRGHLRRLSPEKRLCNNAREKRSAPLLYTLLANNSPYPSFFHSPYVHLFPFFRDGIYRVWKYFFTRISFRFSLHVRVSIYQRATRIMRSFLQVVKDLFRWSKYVRESVRLRIRLSLYNVKINLKMKIKCFWLKDCN